MPSAISALKPAFKPRWPFIRSVRVRLVSVSILARAFVLATLVIVGLSALWLCPFIWLIAGWHLPAIFKYLVFLNLLNFWVMTNMASMGDVRALRAARKPAPDATWSIDIPASRQPWVAELIAFIESKISGRLRGRFQMRLSFVPGVSVARTPGSFGRKWRITVGISDMAVLSAEEIKALVLYETILRFRPPTPAHALFAFCSRRVARWKSALPPHPGLFTFPRCGIEWLTKILRPFPQELEKWSLYRASREVPLKNILLAVKKTRRTAKLQGTYLDLYKSILNRALMPPYMEGMALFCRLPMTEHSRPAFKELEGVWVYERQLLESLLGREVVRQFQLIAWEDVNGEVGVAGWREAADQFRPFLPGYRIADIPALIDDWRPLMLKWCIRNQKAPVVTPDKQRESLIMLVAATFIVVLIETGWRISSALGDDVQMVRETSTLKPFRLVSGYSVGRLTADQFVEACREAQVADVPLASNEAEKPNDEQQAV